MNKIRYYNYANKRVLVAVFEESFSSAIALADFLDKQEFIDVQEIKRVWNGKMSVTMEYQSGYLHKTKEFIKTLLAA